MVRTGSQLLVQNSLNIKTSDIDKFLSQLCLKSSAILVHQNINYFGNFIEFGNNKIFKKK